MGEGDHLAVAAARRPAFCRADLIELRLSSDDEEVTRCGWLLLTLRARRLGEGFLGEPRRSPTRSPRRSRASGTSSSCLAGGGLRPAERSDGERLSRRRPDALLRVVTACRLKVSTTLTISKRDESNLTPDRT